MKRLPGKLTFVLVAAAILSLTGQLSHGRERGYSVGTISSFKGCGAGGVINYGEGRFDMLNVTADFEGVLSGYRKNPGALISYTTCFTLVHKSLQDADISLFSGPGVSIGRVRDNHTDWRLMGGLSGCLGTLFSFHDFPVDISVYFEAVLGGTLNINSRYDSTSKLYHNGIRNAWMPVVALKYRF